MNVIGAKGGGGGGDNRENRGTEIASIAYMKMLFALTEGEAEGEFTGKDIYLDGTPLLDDNGNENFPGVIWEWRSGTVDQSSISGFPSVENEVSVSTELKYGTPWVKSINNTQLSAVRLRIKYPSGLYFLRDSGGKDGYRVEYAVDLSTDGSTYVEYGRGAGDGIGNNGYEQSYRIDLPPAKTGWQIRVRRLTPNSTDGRHADITRIESMTDIIDAKLSYPHTSLLFVQFDAKLFDGRTPTVTVKMKGIIVRVPSNYDPINRTYSGTWDGVFKWAWTNNPAWIFFDIVTKVRYGLGRRITSNIVDKWMLYRIAQYCDAKVSDGAGGTEARHLCDLYISQRTDAWTVLMDLAAIFNGMISWSNNMLSLDADMPREMDPDFVFNKSNIVDAFNFSSSSELTNVSAAIITYSNPANGYQDDQAAAHVQELSARFDFRATELTAVGCTRESEAQRRGLWHIYTNSDDNAVEFKTGMEGRIPRVGKIIGINNAVLAGRSNGGRVSTATGTKILLDRGTQAKPGDRLIINLPTGKAEGRQIKSASGRAVTVESAYSIQPNAESAWVIDQQDLAIQLFRVRKIAIGSNDQVTISGLPFNPNKFSKIDHGAIIEDRPVTVVPPKGQEQPKNILIASHYRVEQGIGITAMEVTWDSTQNAVAYEAQWRQNNGNWITVPRTGNTRFEVDGIYAGAYQVRVRAINALDIASLWAVSTETMLTGKSGKPPVIVGFTSTSLAFGIKLSWGFPAGSADTMKTEIQYTVNSDGSGWLLLSDIPYPSSTYQQMGLSAGQRLYYRARLVDRLGNQSDWSPVLTAQSSADAGDVLSYLDGKINETHLGQELSGKLASISENQDTLARAALEAQLQIADTRQQLDRKSESLATDINGVRGELVAADKHLQGRIDAVTGGSDVNIATVVQQIDVISDEQQQQAVRFDVVVAQVDGNTAQIAKEELARTDGEKALANQISSVKSTMDENSGAITELKKSQADTDSALAQTSQSLEAVARAGLESSLKQEGDNQAQREASARIVTSQKALADDQQALAQRVTQMDTKYGDSTARLQEETKTLSQQGQALSGRYDSLDSKVDQNAAKSQQQTEAVATDLRAEAKRVTDLQTDVDGNTAAIQRVEKAQSEGDEALGVRIDKVNVKTGANAAAITQIQNVQSDLQGSSASTQTSLEALAKADLESALKQHEDDSAQRAAAARIDTKQEVQATEMIALARDIKVVNAELGDTSAKVQQNIEAVTELNGKLSASWSVRVEVDKDGNPIFAGLGLGVDGEGNSDFIVNANRFSVMTPGGTPQLAFAVINGQTVISEGFFGDATIDFAKIKDNLQSENFITGKSGWNIPKNGRAEFYGVKVRGEIIADSGVFRGTVYATDGRFEGTVYANKIEGDVVTCGVWDQIRIYGVNDSATRRFVGGLPYESTLVIPSLNARMGYAGNGSGRIWIELNGKRIFEAVANGGNTFSNSVAITLPPYASCELKFVITGAASRAEWGTSGPITVLVFKKSENRFTS